MGLSLGVILGAVRFVITTIVFDRSIGTVIGLTLLSVCTTAATVGGSMPLLVRAVRADQAVFSNPFITTFVDATGLVIYFLIAKSVLHIWPCSVSVSVRGQVARRHVRVRFQDMFDGSTRRRD